MISSDHDESSSRRNSQQLRLVGLAERHTGLTPAQAQTFVEAASVCFSRHHVSPVQMGVLRGEHNDRRQVEFPMPDDRVRNAYANEIDATEIGAYGVSLAAVEAVQGLVAVRRAETLTGADWYVGPPGSPTDDFENAFRLEVSGTDTGTHRDVQRRLLEKVAQTKRGASNLPAIAAVVGFKILEIAISQIEAKS